MEVPTIRKETCERKVALFRSMVAKADSLSTSEKAALRDEMQSFYDSLETGNVVLGTASVGLVASVLPVIGTITGPIIGGAYGAYKAKKLAPYRDEVLRLIRELSV